MFVYSAHYDLNWPGHVFPTEKYRLVFAELLRRGTARADEVVEPDPVSEDDLLLVHEKRYLRRMDRLSGTPMAAIWEFEAPLYPKTLSAFYRMTQGTVTAGRNAIEGRTIWVNIGGGFHHAFPDHGEGFCLLNDVAVAVRVLRRDGLARRALIVDCDLHQGNGTAYIFRDDADVFTFSIHQERLYPVPKMRSDLDVGLDEGTGDEEYLKRLREGLDVAFDGRSFDVLFYLAGADPYERDRLGSLRLSKKGLAERDRVVLERAGDAELPTAVTLAGGYATDVEDVVEIHHNTCRLAKEYARRRHSRSVGQS